VRVAVPEPAFRVEVFDPYEVVCPTSKYHEVERAFGFTEPLRVAPFGPMPVACPVVTVGALWVVKTWSPPAVVPASLVATRRKWYVAPDARPLTVFVTLDEDVPEPALEVDVFAPYAVVVPYSKR
jgi:hypothetical protein